MLFKPKRNHSGTKPPGLVDVGPKGRQCSDCRFFLPGPGVCSKYHWQVEADDSCKAFVPLGPSRTRSAQTRPAGPSA